MGLLGTLIGGGIGFMFGGPLGAVIGGAIGSNIGVEAGRAPHPGIRNQGGSRTGSQAFRRPGYNAAQAQQAFMVAMISLAAKVAKADGVVHPEEIRSFDTFLKNNLGMSAADRKIAAQIFNEARDSRIPAGEFARQVRDVMGHQPQRLRDLVSLLMGIAMADGQLHPAEEKLIREIAWDLGLKDRDFEESRAMFNPGASLDAAYATLGLSKSASDAEVKKAYRQLAREYHPDVVANKGMGEDFQKFASEKMRAVNNAFDSVKEARGL